MSVVYNQLKKEFFGKKVLVVGLGLQGGGVGVAKFFAELGAKVTVTDKKTSEQLVSSINQLKSYSITFHLGGHDLKDFLETDCIFKGPSVPWKLPEIIRAKEKSIPIKMEVSFFAKYFKGKIIGITGTRGKSTTTNMIFNLLKQSGFSVYLAGGLPGISTINYLKTLSEKDWVVMELSSWALSGFQQEKISPHIAVFTNFYPDHLNYYNNINDYLSDKKAIFLHQKKEDFLIINKSLKKKIKKSLTNYQGKVIWFDKNDFSYQLTYLKGEHNLENSAAALKVSQVLNLNKENSVKIITNFQGLPYRQQMIRKINNITFINDTTSTTPIATIKAIETFKDKKIIIILGGNSKNLPFNELLESLDQVEKIIFLAGSFTDLIIDQVKKRYEKKVISEVFSSLKEAVEKAYLLAKNIDNNQEVVVLFSPGATSFAMFNNEFHRGEEFNKIVTSI